jgi:hypothetical protein
MQPDAEHKQDHTHLGELARKSPIGHNARRERAGEDTSDKIADERRQMQAIGEISEREREYKTHCHRGD